VDSNTRGCYAEYKFATMAMEYNMRVSMPLLDSSPYDCIVELPNGKLKKIQIKSTAKGEHPKLNLQLRVNTLKAYILH
jgi:hypothetical protein